MRALAAMALLLAGCASAPMRTVPHGYARIALLCPDPEADVTIDGAPAGKARDFGHPGRILVRPGLHRIELRGASGIREVREAVLGAGDDVRLLVLLDQGGAR